MLRASAVAEEAGVPSVSLTCEGFIGQAATTATGLGLPSLPVAIVPGHVDVQTVEELRANVLAVTVEGVVQGLTSPPEKASDIEEPEPGEVVFEGTYDEINRFYYENGWSDGLPIVPPTAARVQEFLKHAGREADEELGVLLPDKRSATIRTVAINGVMAGCRPEYMPILVALIEAMCDPEYGVEHSGNTPGADTLIILNGPIIKELGFNYTQGALRDGFMPNTTVGRFWRLYLRNVAGFLLHKTDKGTFGNTWRVVVPENEDVLAKIGWAPLAVDMGLEPGDDAVTISRYTGGDPAVSFSGSTPEELLPYLADSVYRRISWHLLFTMGGTLRPLVLLSPILAETIAGWGWSKRDVQQYLFDHARIPASLFERFMRDWNSRPVWNLASEVEAGHMPKVFAESHDPERLVPLVWAPEHYMIAVTGDPLRTNAYVFAQNGHLGFMVTKKIVR